MAESTIRHLQASDTPYEELPFGSPPRTPMSDSVPMQEIPPGAAHPRFQGAAIQDDGPIMRDSYASSNFNSSVCALNPGAAGISSSAHPPLDRDGEYRDKPLDATLDYWDSPPYLASKRRAYTSPRTKSRKRLFMVGGILLLVIIAAIAVVVIITNKDDDDGDGHSSDSSSGGAAGSDTRNVVTGGDGSTITMEDGTTFRYSNKFGGHWYYDPEDPFNNGARAQSWSPALNETFKYGTDIIRGVNLGGWLTTEPFITPALYEPYVNASTGAVDEWTLSQNMRADTAHGGIGQLEHHYKTFITEQDFAEIAGAGLNWVRIPLPYWAIETRGDEPYLAKTCWTYFLKAIGWARKYGIRINLDLHALPGSQNGWNHSGRLGSVNVLNGPMGYANAQRSLDYIRILAEFISQPQYKNVVQMFGITNEPQSGIIGPNPLQRYYLQAYNLVRNAGGVGEGNGPIIAYHDSFMGQNFWAGFLPGADRISLDSHTYMCFGPQSTEPPSAFAETPCKSWAANTNASMSAFGLTSTGEWSVGITDCGLYLNGVSLGARYEGNFPGGYPRIGSCGNVLDYEDWDAATKQAYKDLALASMDAFQNWFFWTWKIGKSSVYDKVTAPHWSYKLGLENGWLPTDPRESIGKCGYSDVWEGPLAPSATGGSGADTIPASVTNEFAWPPPTISNAGAVTNLPSYTPTGPVPTLPAPTFAASNSKPTHSVDAGSGWNNAADSDGLMIEISGCRYLDPWVGPSATAPSPFCPAAAKRTAFSGE